MHRKTRLNLTDLNPLLTCSLCKGYLIDATTLTECLHSFCRSCLVHYLQTSQNCPKCDTLVHKTRPLHNASSSRLARSPGNLGMDRALQNIVYKLVPGLFKDEMKKRREFYTQHPQAGTSSSSSPGDLEDRGEVGEEALVIYSDDEHMNLSLEYYLPYRRKLSERISSERTGTTNRTNGDNTSKDHTNNSDTVGEPTERDETNKSVKGDTPEKVTTKKRTNGDLGENDDIVDTRYLRCPAAVCVKHIKKFIRNKFDLKPSYQIEITHVDNEDDSLPDDYTLMDVAYIYTWRRNGPLPLVFRVFQSISKRQKTAHVIDNHVSVPKTIPESDGNKEIPMRLPSRTPSPPVGATPTQVPSEPPSKLPRLEKGVDDQITKEQSSEKELVVKKTHVAATSVLKEISIDKASSGVNGDHNNDMEQCENGMTKLKIPTTQGLGMVKLESAMINNNEKTEFLKENGKQRTDLSIDDGNTNEEPLALTTKDQMTPLKTATVLTDMGIAS